MSPSRTGAGSEVLTVRGVTVQFGGLVAVQDVSLAVPAGSLVGLIGPNGAGKSTLLNAISRIVPYSGSISIKERSLSRTRSEEMCSLGVGRTFQHPQLVERLTISENVEVGFYQLRSYGWIRAAFNSGNVRRDRDQARNMALDLCRSLGISDWNEERAANAPYGVQKLAELARAMMGTPDLMLLDEPAAGLTTPEKVELRETVARTCRETGTAFLVIDHDMDFIMQMSHLVYVMNFGSVIAHGDPETVRRLPEVAIAYLGDESATL